MAHEHIVYMMLVDSASRAADESAIRKYAPHLEELAVRDDHKPYQAVAHRAWGIAHRLSGEHKKAAERLEAALSIFEGLEMPWQTGRTLYELGELALAQTEGGAALGYFTRAQEMFEQLGAKPDIARTTAKLEKAK
jgi:tetratricopeptide (TPR) repeat protein